MYLVYNLCFVYITATIYDQKHRTYTNIRHFDSILSRINVYLFLALYLSHTHGFSCSFCVASALSPYAHDVYLFGRKFINIDMERYLVLKQIKKDFNLKCKSLLFTRTRICVCIWAAFFQQKYNFSASALCSCVIFVSFSVSFSASFYLFLIVSQTYWNASVLLATWTFTRFIYLILWK